MRRSFLTIVGGVLVLLACPNERGSAATPADAGATETRQVPDASTGTDASTPLAADSNELAPPSCQETVEGLRRILVEAESPLGTADGSDTPLGNLPSCKALALRDQVVAAAMAVKLPELVDACSSSLSAAARHCFVEPWPATDPLALSTCSLREPVSRWSEACLASLFARAGPWSMGRGELCSRRFPEVRGLFSKLRAEWKRALSSTPKGKIDRRTTRCD